ncbi:hypothetical protein [Sphingomonas pseudosanguinis]|uniref:Uncharacterized protein n=1 Tax=Sphingomonas pseudosanguinis TaxID=413712 RepID=A0A7W6F297_9SPHN|nr:hypothetical protein [Sphingomonas pseudosanguinis]MBB3878175.1 hypothetical protein [Sphingomonas pseudosanguinis]MBN3538044.1 hypothetical protein [Sphingomonas pseudosanguinis]
MKVIGAVILAGLAIVATSFMPTASCADSWATPTTQTFTSCKGHARVVVTPRDLESQLAYFEDKVDGVEPAGQTGTGPTHARARVETLVGGTWRAVWDEQIANDVAPVHVIVRDDGGYTVTFDDWHGTGYGPRAVVIYDAKGSIVRALSLSDIIPRDYIEALPHSVSSIQWRGQPRFTADGRQVVIPAIIPSSEFPGETAYVETTINLATGTVSPAIGLAWQQALATGRRVHAEQRAAEARQRAAFLAPLLGPKDNDQGEWHTYLREAVARKTKGREFPSTTILRIPGASDYAITETWLREALTKFYADQVAVASLSPSNMVPVLRKIASSVPRGSLTKVTLYVAARNDIWPEVREAMSPTGVKLVQLNPDTPIPQTRR